MRSRRSNRLETGRALSAWVETLESRRLLATGVTASTTTLSSSVDPSQPNQSVTFTAVVAPQTGTGTPTGDVTFNIDGVDQTPVALAVVGGVDEATFTTSTLATADHPVTATYAGDSTYATSTSNTVTQRVATGTVTTPAAVTLTSSANPSQSGQAVTFTAVVNSGSGTGTPTGTVTFTIDGVAGTPVPLSVVNGVDEATYTTTNTDLVGGTNTVTAAYSGDNSFDTTTSTALTQTVTPSVTTAPTTVTLTSSANPSNAGQAVTFTAVVAPQTGTGTPTGDVTFTINGVTGTPVPLSVVNGVDEATYTTVSTDLTSGTNIVTASYAGDTNFGSGTSTTLTQTVNAASLPATTTTLTSSANPSTVGQSVTFTAVVAPTTTTGTTVTPTGNVTFTVDGTAGTPVALSVVNGVDEAIYTTSSLTAGSHTVSVSYAGDTNNATSTSTTLTQTVNSSTTPTRATPTLTLTGTPNPSSAGQTVTFTATIAAPTGSTGTSTPSGRVSLVDNGKILSTEAVGSNGQAVFTVSTLTAGANQLLLAYSGDSNFLPAFSAPITQTVTAATGPNVVSVARYGYHYMPTTLVIGFDTPATPAAAQNTANYTVIGPVGKKEKVIPVTSAAYSATSNAVTLQLAQRLNLHQKYILEVNGTPPGGVTGSNFSTTIDASNLVVTNTAARGATAALLLASRQRQLDAAASAAQTAALSFFAGMRVRAAAFRSF